LDRIIELFEARNETMLNHAKSIQICNTNKIMIPANAQIIIASETNLKPIVIHQRIKNGFSTLSKIPVINGPCLGLVFEISFLENTVLIWRIAKTKSVIAPKTEINVLNSGNISKENTPAPNSKINGNSTIEWPTAILIPDLVPSLNPYDMLAAKSGPGAITPDAEIMITNNANSKNCSIIFELQVIHNEINMIEIFIYT